MTGTWPTFITKYGVIGGSNSPLGGNSNEILSLTSVNATQFVLWV